MSTIVSLMVLPTGSLNVLPQILMEQNGVWRDMSPPLAFAPPVSLEDLQKRMNFFLNQIMSQMRNGATLTSTPLRAEFKQHYRDIVPIGVQNALIGAVEEAGPDGTPLLNIHFHPSTEWIPWEILHDDRGFQDFLGRRFQIARLPIVVDGPDLNQPGARRIQKAANLLARHVFDPGLEAELLPVVENTFDGLLPPAAHQAFIPDNNDADESFPNLDDFMNTAMEGDILHITCHGGIRGNNGELAWTLNHQNPDTTNFQITGTIINDLNLVARRPLIFGNACASTQPIDGGDGLMPGFGSRFFARGALAFVGTFAPITQRMAVNFAREFYRRLLGTNGDEGLPVGHALLETKKHFHVQDAGDPSYLYYCLYGPANTVFEREP